MRVNHDIPPGREEKIRNGVHRVAGFSFYLVPAQQISESGTKSSKENEHHFYRNLVLFLFSSFPAWATQDIKNMAHA